VEAAALAVAKQLSSQAAEQLAETKRVTARTKDKATKMLGSAVGQAVTLSLWCLRHSEATRAAKRLETEAGTLHQQAGALLNRCDSLEVRTCAHDSLVLRGYRGAIDSLTDPLLRSVTRRAALGQDWSSRQSRRRKRPRNCAHRRQR